MNEIIQSAIERTIQRKSVLMQELYDLPSGYGWCKKLTEVYDELWGILWLEAISQFPKGQNLSIVATGGYGRQELSPHSDIDIVFIPLGEPQELEAMIKWLFTIAHELFRNQLGVRLSYVYRPISDLPGLDSVSLTNLLDARYVAGSYNPFQKMVSQLWHNFPTSEFLYAKIRERAIEYSRSNESPLVTEPNLKIGAGGVRDFHSYNWIGSAIGERIIPATAEFDSILKIRNLLHLVSGSLQDTFNFARREEIATILKVPAGELGSQLGVSLYRNHLHYLQGKNRLRENRYELNSFAHAIRGEVRFKRGTPSGLTAVTLSDSVRIGLDLPHELPILKDEAGPEMVHVLCCGSQTIRELDKTGIFDLVFPEMSRCRTLMPQDSSHEFTVLEHTLRTLSEFEEIESGSPLYDIKTSLSDTTPTILAILFHDLGKAILDGSHSDTGANITSEVCHRWSLDDQLISQVTWLVREHLTMSQFMRLRDLDHPDTIAEFSRLIPSLEHLKALTLLTYCDIKSVNSQIWSPAQENYLLTLYTRTLTYFDIWNGLDSIEQKSDSKETAIKNIKRTKRSLQSSFEEFLKVMPAHYLVSTPHDAIVHHYELYKRVPTENVIVEFNDHRDSHLTEVTVATFDRSGILVDILGTLYAHNLTLQTIRCSTSEEKSARIIDTFIVSKSGEILPREFRNTLGSDIKNVLQQNLRLTDLMVKMGKDPQRKQQFVNLEVIDQTPMILEFRAPRGRGLAFRLSKQISELGLSIISARLGQWAGNASAAFYVIDPSGSQIDIEKIKSSFFDCY